MFSRYEFEQKSTQVHSGDLSDIRLASLIKPLSLQQIDDSKFLKPQDFVILGYPDDRGVSRNGGRSGAAAGPDEIRKILYRFTPAPTRTELKPERTVWDLGNLRSWSMDLGEAHEAARRIIAALRTRGVRIISLGGGHDWAYPDFVDFEGDLIHLDSHLDVRPQPQDTHLQNHSGTPFRRILDEKKQRREIIPIGAQKHCTALTHLQYLQSYQISPVFLEDLPWETQDAWDFLIQHFSKISQKKRVEKMAMSLDLDVFSQSIAPGVSAPQPSGLSLDLFNLIFRSCVKDLQHLGIYELNPAFDRDSQTARLAAKVIHHFIFHDT